MSMLATYVVFFGGVAAADPQHHHRLAGGRRGRRPGQHLWRRGICRHQSRGPGGRRRGHFLLVTVFQHVRSLLPAHGSWPPGSRWGTGLTGCPGPCAGPTPPPRPTTTWQASAQARCTKASSIPAARTWPMRNFRIGARWKETAGNITQRSTVALGLFQGGPLFRGSQQPLRKER